jgi:hypothetical protein
MGIAPGPLPGPPVSLELAGSEVTVHEVQGRGGPRKAGKQEIQPAAVDEPARARADDALAGASAVLAIGQDQRRCSASTSRLSFHVSVNSGESVRMGESACPLLSGHREL